MRFSIVGSFPYRNGAVNLYKYIIPKTAPNHKDVTRSAHFRAARSVLAEHGIKPRLDLPLALVPHLGGENGGQVFNGNRPALERGRFHFLVVAGPRVCHNLPSYVKRGFLCVQVSRWVVLEFPLAVELGIFDHGQVMLQTYPVGQPPQSAGRT